MWNQWTRFFHSLPSVVFLWTTCFRCKHWAMFSNILLLFAWLHERKVFCVWTRCEDMMKVAIASSLLLSNSKQRSRLQACRIKPLNNKTSVCRLLISRGVLHKTSSWMQLQTVFKTFKTLDYDMRWTLRHSFSLRLWKAELWWTFCWTEWLRWGRRNKGWKHKKVHESNGKGKWKKFQKRETALRNKEVKCRNGKEWRKMEQNWVNEENEREKHE